MSSFLSFFWAKRKPRLDLTDVLIMDVRTPAEFTRGHYDGSVNVPLNTLNNHMGQIAKTQKIVTVCASGIRSAAAAAQLNAAGYYAVNGGAWQNVDK